MEPFTSNEFRVQQTEIGIFKGYSVVDTRYGTPVTVAFFLHTPNVTNMNGVLEKANKYARQELERWQYLMGMNGRTP